MNLDISNVMPAGRPTKYDEEYHCRMAYKIALLGSTDKELADILEVAEDTIYEWKNVHPEFSEALKRGKGQADAQVAKSLFKRANGYSHKAVKILQYEGNPVEVNYTERYPPDTTACIFWLKNRQPDKWRDRQEIKHDGLPEPTITVRIAKPKDDYE